MSAGSIPGMVQTDSGDVERSRRVSLVSQRNIRMNNPELAQ